MVMPSSGAPVKIGGTSALKQVFEVDVPIVDRGTATKDGRLIETP